LNNPKFRAFYPKELENNNILVRILKSGFPDIFLEIMKDKSLKFDKKYPLEFIVELLNKKDDHEYIRETNE
jgi:hypothetical protein